MNSYRSAVPAALLIVVSGLFGAGASQAQIQFEDVSEDAGLTGYTESWGANWGDYNGDNWPDLFNQGHRDYPRFYRNTGEGTFEDIAYEADPGNWMDYIFDDKHGASWADYDNDGDDDLLISVSSTGPAQFLVNYNAVFEDHAVDADLSNDSAARMGTWFDYNNDGHLDVIQVHTDGARLRLRDPSPSAWQDWDFDNASSRIGFDCDERLNYAQLADLNNDGVMEIICGNEGSFPEAIFDYSTNPMTNVTSLMERVSNVNDSAVADLNNDLLVDMVLTRGAMRPSGASLEGANRIDAWLRKDDAVSAGKGFYFETTGDITVYIDHKGMGIYDSSKVYNLSPNGQTVGDAGPVRVEYNAGEQRWRAFLDTGSTMQAYIQIVSTQPISNLIDDQLDTPEFATETMHLVNGPNGLTPDYTSGLYTPVYCGSVVTADFDNDMDQDVYLVCRRGAENLPNRLYENQGDGTFVEVLSHGGEGPLGAGFDVGVGESVVTADYDVDGFMDLYVANGLIYYPVGKGGPDTLLRNVGNGNHWIEIDLVGMESNRDGVGAKVYVTAGGVTQLREQNNGIHRWSQNHQRLHIGLGSNTVADVTVEWPSGAVDVYPNVAADALYDAYEGGAIVQATLGAPVYTTLEAGDECGEPPYDLDYGPAVLLWKDCNTGVWSMRAKGGRATEERLYTGGKIYADAPFSDVSGYNLQGDILTNEDPNELVFSVNAWFSNDKGFDFSTAGQTQSCFNPTTQDIATLIVGGSKKRINAPFDLVTLGACAAPPPPPTVPIECGNPGVTGSDFGMFVWRDCDYAGPEARWHIEVAGGGTQWAGYAGNIYSDVPISGTPSPEPDRQLEGNDTLDSALGDGDLDYIMYVGGSGIDAFQIDVPANSSTCFVPGFFFSGNVYKMGADRSPVNGRFDMHTLESCVPPPPPPTDPACGPASYDAASDNAILVWRDCSVAGPEQHWKVRVAAGGAPWGPYEGALTSQSATLSAVGFSLEANDELDSVPGDGVLDFSLKVGGTGQDGFDITLPEGADACLDLSLIQGGAQIEVGSDRLPKGSQLDLATLGACS